jgi:hypothetical protein
MNCASHWSFTKNHYMMHGQQNIKKSVNLQCFNNEWSWKNVLHQQWCVKQFTTVEKGKKMYS